MRKYPKASHKQLLKVKKHSYMANAWKTIKRLTVGQGGKTVVVEGDEATHVVLTIEEYERLLGPSATSPEDMQADPPQSRGLGGQTTPPWTSPVQSDSPKSQPGEHGDSPTPGSIRIEDLPL